EDTIVAFLRKGKPIDLSKVALGIDALGRIGSTELAAAVEETRGKGHFDYAPEELERREETLVSAGEPEPASQDELEEAWLAASPDPRSGLPDRKSAWQIALESGKIGALEACSV